MAGRTFLITGGTGFLGGAVAVAALRAGFVGQLRLLVRKSPDGTPAMRLFNNLRRLGATERELSSLGQDFMLEADLGDEGAFARHPMLKPVERVIHAAALRGTDRLTDSTEAGLLESNTHGSAFAIGT